jgi:exopolyphosphatase/guanosine-5'-triphosphate,3'-diphosphate pyrophosphatase
MAEPSPAAHVFEPSEQLAALDLGSNSFHLIVAHHHENRIQVIDRMKEMVRLAAGLDAHNVLTPEVTARALECLARFGQRLRHLPARNVRVVGTNTLRKARNSAAFLARAEEVLGHRIEVISGVEEARLIYLGVSFALEDSHDNKRLVIDIGGGSTELILGQQFEPRLMDSLYVGCVGLSAQYFPEGRIKASRMHDAEMAARQELQSIERPYKDAGWDTVIGASGTVLAVNDVIRASGWGSHGISAEALRQLRSAVVSVKDTSSLKLPGLPPERAPVFPGGVAILTAAFEALDIRHMQVSQGALREGLIHDLLGRAHHRDVRESTVQDVARRYHVDLKHAERVRATALEMLHRVCNRWRLNDPRYELLLRWAATLHEVGRDIAHNQHHKHGGYLLRFMDMAGFSRVDQQRLAVLVRAHRRKFAIEEFTRVFRDEALPLMRVCVLLRLAVLLHRNRTDDPLPLTRVLADETSITLSFPPGWLDAHPLTQLDLSEEAGYLRAIPLELVVNESP